MKSEWYEFQYYYKTNKQWHTVGGEQDSLRHAIREADEFEYRRDKRTKKAPVRIVQFLVDKSEMTIEVARKIVGNGDLK